MPQHVKLTPPSFQQGTPGGDIAELGAAIEVLLNQTGIKVGMPTCAGARGREGGALRQSGRPTAVRAPYCFTRSVPASPQR